MKSFFSWIFILVFFVPLEICLAQDTLRTQVFTYASTTRDTVIEFPAGDHTQYEKIWMHYSMRCKKGLVSTSSNRNLGCGEWDYSCNTSIIDSNAVDSLKATHPNYIISGYSEDYFPYTTLPTFTIYEFPSRNITNIQGSVESSFIPGETLSTTTRPWIDNISGKAYYIIGKEELVGFSGGNIQGIRLKNSGIGTMGYFSCKMAKTTNDDLSFENITSLPFTEVVQRPINLASPEADIFFTKPFTYSPNSNLVLEITHFGSTPTLEQSSSAYKTNPAIPQYVNKNDHYLQMGSQGVASLPTASMTSIEKEISISFWARGNGSILPANNSIFYATDEEGNRQLNVHLPWSNSRVFWDCGYGAGSYDRMDKAAIPSEFADTWSHWVFTKNTVTGSMKIYLNGTLWHSATGKTKPIHIAQFFLGGNQNGELPYQGDVDDFCVWTKELSSDEIQLILKENVSPGNNLYDYLAAHYDMNKTDNRMIFDRSAHAASASFSSIPAQKRFPVSELFKGYETVQQRLEISLLKGNLTINSIESTVRDSIVNSPYAVTEYQVVYSNLISGSTRYLWLAGVFPVYDQNGEIIDETEFQEEDIIIVEPLTYYRKFPSKIELLSFVTPYGIGLDFGLSGKTWIFDVTDYAPILKGKKRLVMDRGGEWQEEINIQFVFVKGTPARPVISLQQIWPAEAYGYTAILSNQHLEPRKITVEPEVTSMKIRTVATGHGQEGEFIPRTHSLLVNNTSLTWSLWKECADNAVYPQGGTWVYDRAGWCPGAPSDLREFEIMSMVGSNPDFLVDYGLNTASGDSRYIVNTQLVKYGPNSFTRDANIEEIISPSPAAAHFRKNPICANPEIVIKNNGAENLLQAKIEFGVIGGNLYTYTWEGNLAFDQKTNVTLPLLSNADLWNGGTFFARIVSINNGQDEYLPNNERQSPIALTRVIQDGIIVSMRTNGAPGESSWTLKDAEGTIVGKSKVGLAANTMYNDTIRGLSGCYILQFRDTDDDGISWWANGDGNGVIRAKGLKEESFTVFQPDFGREYSFPFVAVASNSTIEQSSDFPVLIAPNPAYDQINIIAGAGIGLSNIQIMDEAGHVLLQTEVYLNGKGQYEANVNISAFKPGFYLVRFLGQHGIKTAKFVKI